MRINMTKEFTGFDVDIEDEKIVIWLEGSNSNIRMEMQEAIKLAEWVQEAIQDAQQGVCEDCGNEYDDDVNLRFIRETGICDKCYNAHIRATRPKHPDDK